MTTRQEITLSADEIDTIACVLDDWLDSRQANDDIDDELYNKASALDLRLMNT